jgi:hypothetical protein
MPEGHMIRNGEGGTNYKRNAGWDPKIRDTKVISEYTEVYRRYPKTGFRERDRCLRSEFRVWVLTRETSHCGQA